MYDVLAEQEVLLPITSRSNSQSSSFYLVALSVLENQEILWGQQGLKDQVGLVHLSEVEKGLEDLAGLADLAWIKQEAQ